MLRRLILIAALLGLAAGAGFAVNQRNIGGRASHVERDDPLEAVPARHGGGSYNAACRPGEHGAHRLSRCGSESRDPSARLHDKNSRPRPAIEVLKITLHDGLQVRVHHHGAGALVLPELGKNLVRDGKWNGQAFQRFGHGFFVLRVGK
jgi:hypothetical protein